MFSSSRDTFALLNALQVVPPEGWRRRASEIHLGHSAERGWGVAFEMNPAR